MLSCLWTPHPYSRKVYWECSMFSFLSVWAFWILVFRLFCYQSFSCVILLYKAVKYMWINFDWKTIYFSSFWPKFHANLFVEHLQWLLLYLILRFRNHWWVVCWKNRFSEKPFCSIIILRQQPSKLLKDERKYFSTLSTNFVPDIL